jgi:CheY-like chemotaxis protein
VLVVDDRPDNLLAMRAVLSPLDVEIVDAQSGEDALRELLDGDFAVILLDLHMPEMDGYETIREIRSRARFTDLPVIAVTAKAMKGDREKCIEAGAWDYLSKPVDTEQLLAVLRAWLHE